MPIESKKDNRPISASIWLTTIIPSAVIPIAGAILFNQYLNSFRWINEPFHSLLESVGSFAALILAFFILTMRNNDELKPSYIWVATTLMGMGLLDGFHAGISPGNEFVWLHSLATFIGGVTFALVTLPECISSHPKIQYAPYAMAIFSVVVGVISIVTPDLIPAMIKDNQFTLVAQLLNFIGGAGFILAWLYFVRNSSISDRLEKQLMANHALLFGAAGILFHFSVIWDATWWLWHILRLIAYLVILTFFIRIYLAHVTQIKENAEALKQKQKELELSQKIIDHANEGIIVTDNLHNIIQVNAAYSNITGFSASELMHKKPTLFRPDFNDPVLYKKASQKLTKTGYWSGEVWEHKKNGETFPQWLSITAMYDQSKQAINYVSIMHDITERKNTEAKLEQLAYYDALTKLPNRTLFKERLTQDLLSCQRLHSNVAVLVIDLDEFKMVNDTLGHSAGDELLKHVAQRFLKELRESDTVARLGGDEFVVLIPFVESTEHVSEIARKIIQAIKAPFTINDTLVNIGASIGISTFPDDGQDVETLFKHADLALYKAKDSGRNNFKFFSAQLHELAVEHIELKQALKNALINKQFEVHYQPKVDLRFNKIIGMEALIRWNHPEKGMIMPNDFIPFSEESGLIIDIGKQVLEVACIQSKIWSDRFNTPLNLAVNLSTKQFKDNQLLNAIKATLKKSALPAAQLELEITESSLIDDIEEAMSIMRNIRNQGIQLAIDDFGTGYSSLEYLKRFPINTIKIDRSFVKDISQEPDDRAIIETIILLSEKLGIKNVAEGIETSEQLAFLDTLNCPLGQGYLFSKPLNKVEFEAYLEQHLNT